ncbi:MAG TPA: family 10 glycosylhydrolase, partial [Catenuloplanes sp.]
MRLPSPGRPRTTRRAAVAGLLVGWLVVAGAAITGEPRSARPPAAPGRDTAGGPPPAECAGLPLAPRRELRGMWLTTVNNIDWPSRPGLDQARVQAEYRAWLDLAQRMNHNAVFVHVRPSGDAFWPSAYAPWSQWLTGRTDGADPGWDPLAFLVAETHARNLELHAWFNPYRGGQPGPAGPGGDVDKLAPDHPLRRHPDWAVVYPRRGQGARLHFDPGVPEARRFVEDAMLEAVTRYDIDAVHFDDFFYPYPVRGEDFGDDASFARYGRGFARRADWRRDNVNRLVEETSRRIKQAKPWVKFGISPFGIWRNERSDPAGSATRGLQSYDDIYADTRLWVRRQWLDYVVPQLYWPIGFDVADYATLLPWWSTVVAGTRVQLYIGQADYRVGEPGPWRDPGELQRQLTLNRAHGVRGSVHFSAKQVRADRLG